MCLGYEVITKNYKKENETVKKLNTWSIIFNDF